MKSTHCRRISQVLCILLTSFAAMSQSPAASAPILTADAKLSIRNAQHKRDVIIKQQSDLALQIADLQKRIADESTRLAGLFKTADEDYKASITGVCPKDFKLDEETLTCTAVPATAASSSAPASSPKPPSSPGAAVPPLQAKK
jgi:hypothetical protein